MYSFLFYFTNQNKTLENIYKYSKLKSTILVLIHILNDIHFNFILQIKIKH